MTDDRRQMTKRISSFRDLKVYQAAFQLQQAIFEATKTFPKDELYSLVDQIRRASRSIGANIAESWQKRIYQAHFVSKLTDADAEQAETQHWLDTAHACNYLSGEMHQGLCNQCMEIGRMLGAMISNPTPFCRKASK